MEIYLSHMVIFRVVEKAGLNTLIGNGWTQYAATVALVLVGTIVFAVVVQNIFRLADKRLARIRSRQAPSEARK